ncbi:MAG: AbrB/MazE/SpoVT family DNA-binding domain-containing protein [Deltaproteobacteria bacterium]|nr:AbrB/MazE/SpoVT family DNA-binding domain-containing protein [Deltaproteobacteria bacterium]
MEKGKITFKGQVTIPKKIRDALALKDGDSVIFTVEGDHAILNPMKKKSLLDFYGAFPATRPYPGIEGIREEVHKKEQSVLPGRALDEKGLHRFSINTSIESMVSRY